LTARQWIQGAILLALLVLGILLFRHPQAMVAPGPVIPAHAEIADNCLACHAPFRGARTDRCTSCHIPAEIGQRTTRGLPVGHPAVDGRTSQTACHATAPERRKKAKVAKVATMTDVAIPAGQFIPSAAFTSRQPTSL
jgi:hypothetical protein